MEYNENLLGSLPDTVLARETNRHCSFIWRERTKRQIPSYKSTSGFLPKNHYNIHVFDEMTYETAYWLGYYYADGCVCKTTHNRYIVTLTTCDYEVADKLADFYGLDKKLIKKSAHSVGQEFFKIDLCNKHLFDTLNSYGCVPQKSNIVQPPLIDEKYYNNFLLGYFDGDGSISVNTSINQWKISYGTGSPYLFEWLKSIMSSRNLPFSVETKKKKKLFYTVTLIGLAGKVFLQSLYNDENIRYCMQRKYQKYLLLKNIKFKSPNLQNWEKEIIATNQYNTIQECIKIISEDSRNFGWVRDRGTIGAYRKFMVRNNKS